MKSFIGSFFRSKKETRLTIQRLADELDALAWLKTQRCSVNFTGGYQGHENVWIMVHEKAPGAGILAQGSKPTFLEAVNEAKIMLEAYNAITIRSTSEVIE